MRVAVIDCGTNTIRLLVADPGEGTSLVEVDRALRYVRLGQDVDATGRFAPEALERTFAAVDEFATIIAATRPDTVRFIATSAARDASNREDFFAGIRSRLGVLPEVISGDEEARLSFLGALSGGPVDAEPVLVMDVGGGSTELILGDDSGTVTAERSLNMGSVRIRERFLKTDPPLPSEIDQSRQFVNDLIDSSGVPVGTAGTWIGVAGTATSVSAIVAGLTVYDRSIVHNSVVSPEAISALSDHLLSLSVGQTLEQYPLLNPLRAEVICAGALICDEVARRTGRPMLVRETDILDGAALGLLRRS